MSFDLCIETADPSAYEQVSRALAGHPVEIHASASAVIVGFSARTSDETMQQAYAALVSLSRALGYSLFDPQVGVQIDLTKPQAVPPGW